MRLILIAIAAFGFLAAATKANASRYIAPPPENAYHIDVPDALTTPLTAVQCLALNIYHEARGEPLKGQYAVAMVTLNRVHSRHYPGSVCGVVLQHRQFSWVRDGRSDQPTDEAAWRLAYNIAYRFIEGGFVVEWMTTWTHYHRYDVSVNWYRVPPVYQIGAHVFYEPGRVSL